MTYKTKDLLFLLGPFGFVPQKEICTPPAPAQDQKCVNSKFDENGFFGSF